jgi:hypothetical protein
LFVETADGFIDRLESQAPLHARFVELAGAFGHFGTIWNEKE